MNKSESEAVDSVEERQGLPSEKASSSHPATRLRFKKHRNPLRTRPKRSTEAIVRICSKLSSKPRARPEPARRSRAAPDGVSRNLPCSHSAPNALVRHDR